MNKIETYGFTKEPVTFGALKDGELFCHQGDKRDVAFIKTGVGECVDLRDGRKGRRSGAENVARLSGVELEARPAS